jgi:hypothetical protein
MRLLRRFLAAALIAATAFGAASCTTRGGHPQLAALDAPRPGENLPEEEWTLQEGRKSAGSMSTLLWVVPNIATLKSWRFDKEAQNAEYMKVNYFDLGILSAFIAPWYVSADVRAYNRQAGEVGRSGFTWTPLWASTRRGPGERVPKLRASGVPILWSDVDLEGEREKVNIDTYIWTAGPSIIRGSVDMAKSEMAEDGSHAPSAKGWAVLPVTAFGLPGLLAWTSLNVEVTDGTGMTLHGPVFGTLGYYRRTSREAYGEDSEARRTVTNLAWGILWHRSALRRGDRAVVDSRNGILWGMLGWGHRNGAKRLRLLWLPIPLEGAKYDDPRLVKPAPEAAAESAAEGTAGS